MSARMLRETWPRTWRGRLVVLRELLVDIHDVDFAKDFVQLVEMHVVVFFAEGGEDEVHAIGERAA